MLELVIGENSEATGECWWLTLSGVPDISKDRKGGETGEGIDDGESQPCSTCTWNETGEGATVQIVEFAQMAFLWYS